MQVRKIPGLHQKNSAVGEKVRSSGVHDACGDDSNAQLGPDCDSPENDSLTNTRTHSPCCVEGILTKARNYCVLGIA
jgi:hypothetical protein